MVLLPTDIYQQIFELLPQETLLKCRFLNKSICGVATSLAFRHLRLEASRELSAFVNITHNEGLRNLVREITIDTWISGFEYHANEDYEEPKAFLRVLPYLRFFRNLLKLNVRFNEYCGNEDGEDWGGYSYEETYDFRFMVLDVIFRSVAGTWTAPYQEKWLEEHDLDEDADEEDDDFAAENNCDSTATKIPGVEVFPTSPIPISSLTVSNLADYDDPRLASLEACNIVMSLPSLRELKLLVAFEQIDASPESATWLPEKYDFMESLPRTWLSPPTAQNLRVLSLYCASYWGWNPKMDFRTVNALAGPMSGFPNLRVLALGNYVFSHDWQVDWIASLGLHNGRGGLEELFLDDCPIMWQARNYAPFDESTTVLGTDVNGQVVEVSNEGYNLKSTMNGGSVPTNNQLVVRKYDLRWNKVLQVWKDRMDGLKVFKMGSGYWWEGLPDSEDNNEIQDDLTPDDQARIYHRREHNVFLNYAAHLKEEREYILQYIHFNIGLGPSPWIERDTGPMMMRDRDNGLAEYEESKKEDEAALEALLQLARGRRSATIN